LYGCPGHPNTAVFGSCTRPPPPQCRIAIGPNCGVWGGSTAPPWSCRLGSLRPYLGRFAHSAWCLPRGPQPRSVDLLQTFVGHCCFLISRDVFVSASVYPGEDIHDRKGPGCVAIAAALQPHCRRSHSGPHGGQEVRDWGTPRLSPLQRISSCCLLALVHFYARRCRGPLDNHPLVAPPPPVHRIPPSFSPLSSSSPGSARAHHPSGGWSSASVHVSNRHGGAGQGGATPLPTAPIDIILPPFHADRLAAGGTHGYHFRIGASAIHPPHPL